MSLAEQELILVLDFGGQYTQLIARRIRDCNVYCEIEPYSIDIEKIKAKNPRGIIFSGGPSSVYGEKAPVIDPVVYELGIPVLGICYGMQLMTHQLQGKVVLTEMNEYGRTSLKVVQCDNIMKNLTLKSYLFDICGCSGSWSMGSFLAEAVQEIKQRVGQQRVLCALSGGVDSSVAAVLVHRAVGDNLTCVFVDHGLLRKNEAQQVVTTFRDQFNIKLIHVDASERFLGKLKGVTDPEQKRKIIGTEFIRVFEEESGKLGEIDFLVQGTLYPDVVESGTATTQVIKSHHNVGGLPEDMKFELVEPLRWLFKDEVRRLGEELGIPEEIVWRQPFPGPGLAVRILGEITKEKLGILREADFVVRDEIKNAGLNKEIWQYFAVLPNLRSVGVKGDGRTYAHAIAIRAVHSHDGMTADWAKIPHDVLGNISTRLVNEVAGVNRVVYDITAKPPGTIEWE